MRLLVVSQYFWPETFRVNDLVGALTARGHAVTVLTGLPNYPEGQVFPAFRRDPAAFARYQGADLVRVPILPRGQGSLRLALNYLSFVVSGLVLGGWRLRGRSFDAILVCQLSPVTVALPALLLRRLKRAPALLWVLDLWPESLAAVGVVRSPRILGWVGRLVGFIYRRSDRILVASKAFSSQVARHGGLPGQLRYFPGWAEPLFQGALADAPDAPELAPFRDTFNLLFAGNIGDGQDFPALLEAAADLGDQPQVRWLIVGDGRAAESLRQGIRDRGLEGRVILLGRHPIERMPSFFKGAQALVVTLRKDPFMTLTIPGKVQSYLASGLPVLGMLDGEGARVIREAEAGLVAPSGQGLALAACVRALVAMPEAERKAMGARGQAYCARTFDRDTLVAALEGWIGELLPSPARARMKPAQPCGKANP